MTRKLALLAIVVAVFACIEDRDLCAEFGLVEDPVLDRCVCPSGTSERVDGGGCEAPDGGPSRDDSAVEPCIDPTCTCTHGTMRACPGGSDIGACTAGTQVCVDGAWGVCGGAIGPTAESCDAIDNDCDGVPDNGSAAASCASASRVTEAGCSGGACFAARCALGYSDCDGMFANGCEAQLGTASACLSCGDTCGWDCDATGCNDAVQLSLGARHSCALRENRGVVCWGQGSTVPAGVDGSDYRSIDVGSAHVCAVTAGGTVRCWGDNSNGQLEPDPGSASSDSWSGCVPWGIREPRKCGAFSSVRGCLRVRAQGAKRLRRSWIRL